MDKKDLRFGLGMWSFANRKGCLFGYDFARNCLKFDVGQSQDTDSARRFGERFIEAYGRNRAIRETMKIVQRLWDAI